MCFIVILVPRVNQFKYLIIILGIKAGWTYLVIIKGGFLNKLGGTTMILGSYEIFERSGQMV